MFAGFRNFVSRLTSGEVHPARFAESDYRLAAAALLIHAAAIDGNISELERDKLHAIIKRRFELDDQGTDELVADAIAAGGRARRSVLPADLEQPDAVERIGEALQAQGLEPDIVVNNAGFGLFGAFGALDRARQRAMIDLNVRALSDLSYAFIE